MRVDDAKEWVRTYIKANRDKIFGKTFSRSLNWEIVKLSHEVFRGHRLRGHLVRRKIRRQLWAFASVELRKNRKPTLISRLKLFFLGHY